jgi:hypothetical protein
MQGGRGREEALERKCYKKMGSTFTLSKRGDHKLVFKMNPQLFGIKAVL